MIAIVDYGVGNLFSLNSSLEMIGAESVVTADEAVLRSADKILLPGVGAFEDAAKKLRESGLADLIKELAAEERALVAKHMVMPTRPQTVSWRLLGYHATYIELFSDLLLAKAAGDNFLAKELHAKFKAEFGKFEVEIERYYDQGLVGQCMERLLRKPRRIEL